MSIFPRSDFTRGRRPAPERDPQAEAEGVLARPIHGMIYLIEEEDLERLAGGQDSPRSGLVSRH